MPMIEAGDGEPALDMVRRRAEFDLLLTDVVMPGGMTGYELAERRARCAPIWRCCSPPAIPSSPSAAPRSPRSGPLLSKPYRKADLGRALRAIFDGRGGGDNHLGHGI